MTIGCIIQARMGSSRLPGKVLKEVKGKPMLFYVLDQTSNSKLIDKIVVATTTNPEDKAILETVKNLGYDTFAGSEGDVLDRYYQAAKKFNFDIVVRITADCPLVDPEIIDKTIKKFQDEGADYCCNQAPPTHPDGLDVEVFTFDGLEKSWNDAKWSSEREHVTFYFNKNKDFKLANYANPVDLSSLRVTVDEPEDYELVKKIIEKVNKSPILLADILDLFEKEPELKGMNSQYERNAGHKKALDNDKIVK